MGRDAAASCRGVAKTYRIESGTVPALRGVSVDFPAGAVTAVVGPSGSGKSSLLRIIAGLDNPDEGTVRVGNVELDKISARSRRRVLRNLVSYVFQSPSDNFVSYLTVLEHLQIAGRGIGVTSDRCAEVLATLGIGHRGDHLPDELSGGEQQRAALAQALVADVPLIVADEPTAELDGRSAHALLGLVTELAVEGITFVLATHDPDVISIASNRIDLDHGSLVAGEARSRP